MELELRDILQKAYELYDDVVAVIYPEGAMRIEASVEEANLSAIHVGDPIVPDLNAPRIEEVARMRDLAHQTMLDMAGIVSNPWPSSID